MSKKFILSILFLFIVSSAFSQKVLSLHPLFTEQDAVMFPEAEGKWSIQGIDLILSVYRAGDNFYLLKSGSENNSPTSEVVFIKLNGEYFLDLAGVIPDSMGDEDYKNSFIKGHTLYKILTKADTLVLFELNYAWFYQVALNNKIPFSYQWIDHAMLLTLKTQELKSFFSKHKSDQEVFKNSIVLIKRPSNTEGKKIIIKNNAVFTPTENHQQKCLPAFPMKDGWLGGDGDVSVRVNDTQTLFLFSDTYVGNKNQVSRDEGNMKMVSSTVAVETCSPDGKTEVHYSWNNMYSDNPEPLFRSFTKRYKFWVNDAFMINSSLYVLLEKIAPMQAEAPDEIFAFSSAGYTLAKISNPSDLPVQWKIDYIPLPDFVSPSMGIRSPVVMDHYIYFFVNRNNQAQLLVRKNLDFIDDPEKPFDYYALNHTWKTGIRADDMESVIIGFRGTTVNYHADSKQWVMVSDIKYLDNKIRIRTSQNLTGPWSEEKTVYECPEVTPGNSAYSKSNFCYLARECIQNYDSEKKMMLITYDINNSDFSEIISNPKIYTPKVIMVSLKK